MTEQVIGLLGNLANIVTDYSYPQGMYCIGDIKVIEYRQRGKEGAGVVTTAPRPRRPQLKKEKK